VIQASLGIMHEGVERTNKDVTQMQKEHMMVWGERRRKCFSGDDKAWQTPCPYACASLDM